MEDFIAPVPGDSLTGQPGNTPQAPAPVPAQPVADQWQQRYAGLQQRLAQFGYNKLDAIPTAAAWSEAQTRLAQITEMQGTISQRDQTLQTAQADLGLAQSRASELETRLNKLSLIAQMDPQLARFADSIPTIADAEAQKQAIASFKDSLSAYFGGVAPLPGTPVTGQPPIGTPGVSSAGTLRQQSAQAYDAWVASVQSNQKADAIAKLRNEYYRLDAEAEKYERAARPQTLDLSYDTIRRTGFTPD